jgi:hypothetical protein
VTDAAPIETEQAAGDDAPRRTLVLGVVVAPGLAHELTVELVAEIEDELSSRYASVQWDTELTVDRLVEPGQPLTAIFDAARRKLLESRWDLGIVVTDLPLHVRRRPVTHRVSPTHSVAVVSLPALGALALRQRLRRTLVRLVGELLGGEHEESESGRWAERERSRQRALVRELVSDTPTEPGGLRLLFVPAVLAGNARLLVGMVRANRPWRFAARLYGVLIAALAVGLVSIVFADHWRIAVAMWWERLAILCLASTVGATIAIIVVHHLWERAPDPRVRAQAVLFNFATSATIIIGIATLYVALSVLLAAAVWLMVTPSLFEEVLGRDVGVREYAAIVWFFTSLGALGGGLGAALESDEQVREAAYVSRGGAVEQAERRHRGRRRASTHAG